MSAHRQPVMTPAVEQVLSAMGCETEELARALRLYLLEHLPGIAEFPDTRDHQLGYGFGPGYKHLICVILISRSGVKLAFYRAVDLPDPDGLLLGKGKVHKSVAVKSLQDIQRPALLSLLSHALIAYHARRNTKPARRNR